MIAGRINVALIRAHWSEILRVVASIRTGTVTASLIMRQLASYPRQNGVAAALRELGRLERTLFTLDWIEDPELRRDDRPGAEQGRSPQQPGARGLHPSARRNPRPHLREPAAPRLRPQPARHRHHPVEHAISRARRRRPAPDRGCPGPPAGPPLPARLGARQPDRRLRLGARGQASENTDGLRPLRPCPIATSQAA